MFLATEKRRIYAAYGVSQTPTYLLIKEGWLNLKIYKRIDTGTSVTSVSEIEKLVNNELTLKKKMDQLKDSISVVIISWKLL